MNRAILLATLLAVCVPVYTHAEEPNVPPVITTLSLTSNNPNPLYAEAGNSIRIVIETNEAISIPVVSINGMPATMEEISPTSYVGSYLVSIHDPSRQVALSVTVTDLLGSSTTATTVTVGGMPVVAVGDDLSPDFIFEATSAAGTPFVYSSRVVNVTTMCTPASGSLFAVGTTEVVCMGLDAEGSVTNQVARFTVTVTDTTAPVVTLTGDRSLTLTEGATYTELGATVTDNGDPAVAVAIGSAPNVNTVGTYTVTYTATDASGNTASKERVVDVTARPNGKEGEGGGGGGGGGSRRSTSTATSSDGEVLGVSDEKPAVASVEPSGEVLGASTFSFTRHLKQGDKGEDVTELQNLLTRSGHFTEAPTGYFGPITAAALRAYQTANGLEAVGYIGPRTLALLNAGQVAPTTDRTQSLMAEIARLQAEIARLQNN